MICHNAGFGGASSSEQPTRAKVPTNRVQPPQPWDGFSSMPVSSALHHALPRAVLRALAVLFKT